MKEFKLLSIAFKIDKKCDAMYIKWLRQHNKNRYN